MAVGDYYRLTLSGNQYGQVIQNIFYYRNTNVDGTASDIGNYFKNGPLLTIIAALSNTVTYTNIAVINMTDAGDYWENAFSFQGLRIGEAYESFGAFGFLSFPDKMNFKAGGKRFAGVAEADVLNGIPLAGQLLRLDNIATALGAIIDVSGAKFRPSFFSRKCVKDPVTHKCTDVFTEAFGQIASYAWKWVTTQNSRKRNVGI